MNRDEIFETMTGENEEPIFQTVVRGDDDLGLIIHTNEGREFCFDMNVLMMERLVVMLNNLLEAELNV